MATAETTPQDYSNRESWRRRPWMARAIRLCVFAVPIIGAIGVTTMLGGVLYRGSWPTPIRFAWIGLMFVIATVVSNLIGRWTERLLPLSALCRMNLNFPQEAPSRVKTALRMGNTANGERVINEFMTQGLAPDPQEAALQVLDLIEALNRHDRKTRGHTEKVRALSEVIAQEMGLSEFERNRLRWASVLHDIGKLAVPAAILNKPGKPDADEWALIQSHPMAGFERMGSLRGWLGDSARAVEEHHERWDGSGYPRKLRGEEIALAARIVAVADSFEVMTAARSYKKPMSYEDARAELVKCSGTHFDPAVVRAFLRVGSKKARVSAGVFSSAISHLASGNGPVATIMQTVSGGVSASAGVSVMAPFVRGIQMAAKSAPESGLIFAKGGAGTLLSTPLANTVAAAKATVTTLAITVATTVAPSTIPDNLALRPVRAEVLSVREPVTGTAALPLSTAPVLTAPPTTAVEDLFAPAVVTLAPVSTTSTTLLDGWISPTIAVSPSTTPRRPTPTTQLPTTTRPVTSTTGATTTTAVATTTTPVTTTTALPSTTLAPSTTLPPPPPAASTTTTNAPTTTPTTTTTSPLSCAGQWTATYVAGSVQVIRCESAIDMSAAGGASPVPGITGNFATTWAATVNVASTQLFSFVTSTDDVSELTIDGVRVFRQGSGSQSTSTLSALTEKTLTSGPHTIELTYRNNGGTAKAALAFTPGFVAGPLSAPFPTPVALTVGGAAVPSCNADEWLVQYFDNTNLSGSSIVTVCDATPDETYNGANPPPGMSDFRNFSASWTSEFTFAAGITRFKTRSDDSLRIWVDGRQIMEKWGQSAAIEVWTTPKLNAGRHNVVVHFKNNSGPGDLKLEISPTPTVPPTTTTTTASPTTTTTASPTTTTIPTTTTTTTTIPTTTTTTTATTTTATTTTTTSTTTTTTTPAPPGAIACSATEWRATYYSGVLKPIADLGQRQECLPALNYFTLTSPAGVTDDYAARFEATIDVGADTAGKFRWFSDGEFAVYVDANPAASRGSTDDGIASFGSVDVQLSAGTHSVIFELVDRSGSSAMSMALPAGVSGPASGVIPANAPAPSTSNSCANWHALYSTGLVYGGSNSSDECIANPVNINWGLGAPVGLTGDVFNSEFTKVLTLTPGYHTLNYDADDEFTLWVGPDMITSTIGWHSFINGRTSFFIPGPTSVSLRVTVRSRDLGDDSFVQFTIV